MKFFAFMGALLFALSSQAIQVLDGHYSPKEGAIQLDVQYMGCGPEEGRFSLELQTCRESDPVSCDLTLVDNLPEGVDTCGLDVRDTFTITLEEAGLNTSYYDGAELFIYGDDSNSAVVITLPR